LNPEATMTICAPTCTSNMPKEYRSYVLYEVVLYLINIKIGSLHKRRSYIR